MQTKKILSICLLILYTVTIMGLCTATKETTTIDDMSKCIEFSKDNYNWKVMESSDGYDVYFYNYKIINNEYLKIRDPKTNEISIIEFDDISENMNYYFVDGDVFFIPVEYLEDNTLMAINDYYIHHLSSEHERL